MERRIGMRAFFMLLAVMLVGVVMLPAVSAQSPKIEFDSENLVNIADISLPFTESKVFFVDSTKYDKQMTKEEFQEANAGYIEFLYEQFGDKAQQLIDDAYATSATETTKRSTTIVRIGSYDMYLWPYINTEPNTSSNNGGVNAIFFRKTVDEMASTLKSNGWESALGWTEWGLHGPNLDNMIWTNSPGSNPLGNHQLQDGSYFGDRYHLVMIDGHYSPNIGDDWCYGNCHYEYWSWSGMTHYLYPNSLDSGRDHLYNELSDDASASWIYLQNPWSGFFDGWGYIFDIF